MKRISVLVVLLISVFTMKAQHEVFPFFDDKGVIRIETTELDAAADTLVTVSHRADDIVWSRVVYRIIDMRYKQNYPLYYPTKFEEGMTERSLFMVMAGAIVDGMPLYMKGDRVKPNYRSVMSAKEISEVFTTNTDMTRLSNEDEQIILENAETKKMVMNNTSYDKFVRNQLKFLIQEVVFFDKHTSRLCSKILAIAPLYQAKLTGAEAPKEALYNSLLGWIAFDQLRPYLAKHYVSSDVNATQRVTFDEFFAKKLYSSYVVGVDNGKDQLILDYTTDAARVRQEQARIEAELLNFEQDLWEY